MILDLFSEELLDPEVEYPLDLFPPLRQFQRVGKAAIAAVRKRGVRRFIFGAPTGAGKTVMALLVAISALRAKDRLTVGFLVDRKVLVRQTSAASDRFGMTRHGIMQAENTRDLHLRYTIISAGTAERLPGGIPHYDLLIVDECHQTRESVREWAKKYPDSYMLGLSATPFAKGLGELYEELVSTTTMDDLTRDGTLVPFRVLSSVKPNMRSVVAVDGEWDSQEAGRRGVQIIGDIVSTWLTHNSDRKTIAFCSSIDHVNALVAQFTSSGIQAAAFISHTVDEEKDFLQDEFSKPGSRLQVLVSVDALTKGFDVPEVSCVIDARPMRKSLSTFMQMLGRGLRSAAGKTDCVLQDHSGNIIRFAEDFVDIYFNGLPALDRGLLLDKKDRAAEERPERELKCPNCQAIPFVRVCLKCGFEREVVDHTAAVSGEVHEFAVLNAKKQKVVLGESDLHVYQQLLTYCKQAHQKNPKKWKEDQVDSRARRLYKDVTGAWPSYNWQGPRNPQPEVPILETVQNKITHLNMKQSFKKRAAA